MKRITVLIIILLQFYFLSNAQNTAHFSHKPAIITELNTNTAGKGQVQIIEDKRIEELMYNYIESNSLKTTIIGYRLRIFSESAQEAAKRRAYDAKSKFMSHFPDIEAYIKYEAPDWKVYVGDFRSRTDAFRLKKQIESIFPRVFIVETPITYTKL